MPKRKSQQKSRQKTQQTPQPEAEPQPTAQASSPQEQREHPRVQLPLIVEVTHHVLGTVRATAKDVSGGGIFIDLVDERITVGAKFKIRIVTIASVDARSTPTVDVTVVRIQADGMGLEFATRTAQYLWESVDRVRDELKIGRDYFQVHQSVALRHPERGVLLVQKNGRWMLPGVNLHVGEANVTSLRDYLETELGISEALTLAPLATTNRADLSAPEAATFSVIYQSPLTDDQVTIREDSDIKDRLWARTIRDVIEITFAIDEQREKLLPLMEEPAEAPR